MTHGLRQLLERVTAMAFAVRGTPVLPCDNVDPLEAADGRPTERDQRL